MKKVTIDHVVLYLLYFLISIGIIVSLAYIRPRKIVEATQPQTTQLVYKQGEEVIVTGHTKLFVSGTDINDIRLQCGNSQYFIKQINLNIRPVDIDYKFSLGTVPLIAQPSPPPCRVVTTTTYRVNFLLGFKRDYQEVFETNEFTVVSQ